MSTIVVTGANRGLGLALAQHHAAAGDHVIGGCRNPEAAADLRATGAEVHPLDMSSEASIDAFAAAVGDRPIDVLYNNAGIDARALGAPDGLRGALDITVEQFRGVMEVNVVGPMHLVQVLAGNLRARPGKVANISSQVGSLEVGQRLGRDVSYGASKAALNMVSIKQAQVLRNDGVVVIAFHPGWVRSDMGGKGADLEPMDAAAGVARVIDGASIDDTGTFRCWDGSVHPW